MKSFSNASYAQKINNLDGILQKNKNIALYQRDVAYLDYEIQCIKDTDAQIRLSGTKGEVLEQLKEYFKTLSIELPQLEKDISTILDTFNEVSKSNSFRLHLLTVNDGMCSKFHTDINDLRLICTYSGKGTYWLPEEAVNRFHYQNNEDVDKVVSQPELMQQASAGDILILKGVLFPDAKAIIHKSPPFNNGEEKRVLLRIDTNKFGIFI